jgi:aspartate/methionine/tyrosine aminotransferase
MLEKVGLDEFIARHRDLEFTIQEGRRNFISDWNGSHPFVEQFLGAKILNFVPKRAHYSKYIYYDEKPTILNGIGDLHYKIERLKIHREHILAGPGASSLLAAFSLWLHKQGHREIFYVPPLYYTMHFFLKMLNIHARPISGKQPFEPGAVFNLPSRKTILIITDPVWFAGFRMTETQIQEIADWQKRTDSLIFVDGSFQFTQWNGSRFEQSSVFSCDSTFRLVCPTKALAIPSFRFAYLLHPPQFHDDLLFLYENLVGGATISDLAFAERALNILGSKAGNRILTDFFQTTYTQLLENDIIRTKVAPECGYFVFALPLAAIARECRMDQEFFELKGYPGYVRINLMVANKLCLRVKGRRGVARQPFSAGKKSRVG